MAEPLDDCWNRIGVRGDQSCPLLAEHIHCRNCPVYSSAALRLLDRYALQHDEDDASVEIAEQAVASRSLLLFRLGEEWLALATRVLVEVAPLAPIHSLPHQRTRALLGVANVRGALVACLSLSELLGLEPCAPAAPEAHARIAARLLVLDAPGGHLLVPVDEVQGIQRIALEQLTAAERDNRLDPAKCSRGVLQWQGRSLRLLDEEQLLQSLLRSLA
ncbi:chemotaxis protein CheW [Pseudomonas sp. CAU 1711]|uniref:chemotaxis protein CheW n=1 Tax=Pseudomonas sp. CAU 1711 TaxID=3140356 RepID=UPI003260635B